MSSVAQIYTGKIELSARPDFDFSVVQHVRVVREISDQFCFLRTNYPTKKLFFISQFFCVAHDSISIDLIGKFSSSWL